MALTTIRGGSRGSAAGICLFAILTALAIALAIAASPAGARSVPRAKGHHGGLVKAKRQMHVAARAVAWAGSRHNQIPQPTPSAPAPVSAPTPARPSKPSAAPPKPKPTPTPAPGPIRQPIPAPTPPPAADPASRLFSGAHIKDFSLLQEAPSAITEVPDPLGSNETTLKMTVNDKDIYPITPTENPRAQALSPSIIKDGDEFWLQTKFMLPQDFPSVPGWMSLASIYGPPFNGSSPWQVGIDSNEFRWQRNANSNYDIPWRMPLVRGKWVTVLLHERFASDGWVEMWVDGQQINFFSAGNYNPSRHPQTTRLEMATMDSSNNGGANAAKIMQYRQVGMFESATVYFGALEVGKTRESVEHLQ
jgi:hypothetical protein